MKYLTKIIRQSFYTININLIEGISWLLFKILQKFKLTKLYSKNWYICLIINFYKFSNEWLPSKAGQDIMYNFFNTHDTDILILAMEEYLRKIYYSSKQYKLCQF